MARAERGVVTGDLRGRIGDVVYRVVRGRQVVQRVGIPTGAPTVEQVVRRQFFRLSALAWSRLRGGQPGIANHILAYNRRERLAPLALWMRFLQTAIAGVEDVSIEGGVVPLLWPVIDEGLSPEIEAVTPVLNFFGTNQFLIGQRLISPEPLDAILVLGLLYRFDNEGYSLATTQLALHIPVANQFTLSLAFTPTPGDYWMVLAGWRANTTPGQEALGHGFFTWSNQLFL